jgi:UTP--glucose-1-phosphate uridylyltransferase
VEITKAVIPAAGLGTRFLPFTKAVPKEMLPILNKPAIQYIVEEGINSGISNFFMVTSKSKEAIANYLDSSPCLDMYLQERGKEKLLDKLNRIIRQAHFTYIRQSEPLGLGHAIGMARHSIGKEYFGILLPDDLIFGKQPGLDQLIKIAHQEKASVVAVQEVPREAVSSYGIIAIKKQITPNLYQVGQLVEKPSQKDAPSTLAIIGRYVLSHKIFESIDEISNNATDEIQLTDAISNMMGNSEKVLAYKVQGQRFDTGTPLGWLKANIHIALQDPDYAPAIKEMLNDLGSMNINSHVVKPKR